ncbi:MAG: thiamine phosphate synthase [Clostridium sp.]|nr:thiamine phosphate synthase [Clostridium sp.]
MKQLEKDLLLYGVTDRAWLGDRTLAQQVEEAVLGGATFIQLREKTLTGDALLAEARDVRDVCRKHGIPFVINDSVELAERVGADGVHVGQGDMEAGKAREILGPDKIIGVSAKTVEQALLAEKNGADYLGVGAVFPTGSKSDASVISHETLKAICSAVKIPVIAIGGITADNVKELRGSGICGVAVISALFAKQDVRAAAGDMRRQVLEMLGK